jgi:hypothetical protein
MSTRELIESWPKLYGRAQSPKRLHCGANRTIAMHHAWYTLSATAFRNWSLVELRQARLLEIGPASSSGLDAKAGSLDRDRASRE